jgi:hypothetical protein
MASVSAIRRGQALWCGSPDTVIASARPPAARPLREDVSLSFRTRAPECSELRRDIEMSPVFFISTASPGTGQGKLLLERDIAARTGHLKAQSARRLPGANGP